MIRLYHLQHSDIFRYMIIMFYIVASSLQLEYLLTFVEQLFRRSYIINSNNSVSPVIQLFFFISFYNGAKLLLISLAYSSLEKCSKTFVISSMISMSSIRFDELTVEGASRNFRLLVYVSFTNF